MIEAAVKAVQFLYAFDASAPAFFMLGSLHAAALMSQSVSLQDLFYRSLCNCGLNLEIARVEIRKAYDVLHNHKLIIVDANQDPAIISLTPLGQIASKLIATRISQKPDLN